METAIAKLSRYYLSEFQSNLRGMETGRNRANQKTQGNVSIESKRNGNNTGGTSGATDSPSFNRI